MTRLTAAILIVLACAALARGDVQPPPVRALFIGNSLTYANDLPGMVEAAAGSRVECEAVAYPDFGLEEHWRSGEALRAIRRGGWTHVVLQQGPSSLPESRRILVQYARRFAPEIRKAGAEVVIYGVWPDVSRLAYLDAVTASYGAAANETDGTMVAVGEGWRAAWAVDASLPLYGGDGFHPSALGSYLGALMLAEQLTGARPAVPAGALLGATPAQLRIVHAAAASALKPAAR